MKVSSSVGIVVVCMGLGLAGPLLAAQSSVVDTVIPLAITAPAVFDLQNESLLKLTDPVQSVPSLMDQHQQRGSLPEIIAFNPVNPVAALYSIPRFYADVLGLPDQFVTSGSLGRFQVSQDFDGRFSPGLVPNGAKARINESLTFDNIAFLQWRDGPCDSDVDVMAIPAVDCGSRPPSHGRGRLSHHVSQSGIATLLPSRLTILRWRWD